MLEASEGLVTSAGATIRAAQSSRSSSRVRKSGGSCVWRCMGSADVGMCFSN